MNNQAQVLWALIHKDNMEMSRKELMGNTSLREKQFDASIWALIKEQRAIKVRREKTNTRPYIKAYYYISNLKHAKFLLKKYGVNIEYDS